MPVHVVSEALGHADVKITLTVYAHLIRSQRSDRGRRLGALLYGPPATGTEGGS